MTDDFAFDVVSLDVWDNGRSLHLGPPPRPPVLYTPVVMVIDADVLARLEPGIRRITQNIASTPELEALCARNGWPPEALALGMVVEVMTAGVAPTAASDDGTSDG